MNNQRQDRLFELLSDEALNGLSSEEQRELANLKKQFPEWVNDFSLELAAVAVSLFDLDADEPLPANIRAKIITDAHAILNSSAEAQIALPAAIDGRELFVAARDRSAVETVKPSFFGQWLGWSVAAAACVALAVNLWLTRPQTETAKIAPPVSTPVVETMPNLSAAEQREQLIATAPDLIKTDLKAADAKSAAQMTGDVVWSAARQKGFVHFRGLPANDAGKETYQLWIVDASRNVKTPVSGGVFDARDSGEIVVPVNAQLEIKNPKAFAVTLEKAGGVVVSNQEKVVAIGKI